MLYKLGQKNGKFDKLDPVEFKNFSDFQHAEKDLETLIADNMLEVLFEHSKLMPIFQERPFQEEADICALNEMGELYIFELKRESANEGAVHQALRYVQHAGQWSYATMQEKYRKYKGTSDELTQAHKEAFGLEYALDASEMNNKQHLYVVGSAADDSLIDAVDYWRKQGISIAFLPYRVYDIGGEKYFEFFALPYDRRRNLSDLKGVLFDTNNTYDENSIWYMMENSCVAAFGDAKRFVEHISQGDTVFFSHTGHGIVAAAKVAGDTVKVAEKETWYRKVKFITPFPRAEKFTENRIIKAMPFKKVSEITGKSFYWARTIKVPYLSVDEAKNLAEKLESFLKKECSE